MKNTLNTYTYLIVHGREPDRGDCEPVPIVWQSTQHDVRACDDETARRMLLVGRIDEVRHG